MFLRLLGALWILCGLSRFAVANSWPPNLSESKNLEWWLRDDPERLRDWAGEILPKFSPDQNPQEYVRLVTILSETNDRGPSESANKQLDLAMDMAQKLGMEHEYLTLLISKSDFDHDEAHQILDRYTEQLMSDKNYRIAAKAYSHKTFQLLARGQFQEALPVLRKGIAALNQASNITELDRIAMQDYLAATYARTGDQSKALKSTSNLPRAAIILSSKRIEEFLSEY
ncbi:MAG: hypothetical protein HRU19_20025 [Pseudobacteriovorax sp.]|nr:hypothetical protein [Pseudobacteriovorax sp.]